MTVSFSRNRSEQTNLDTIRKRAIIYNTILNKYCNFEAGKLPVPEKNLKRLEGKFATIRDYIDSDKRWQKLLDFDDSKISFADYIDIMVKNWESLRLRINYRIPKLPVFNMVLSNKLEYMYWEFKKKDIMSKQKNMYRVTKEAKTTLVNDFRSEKYNFVNHSLRNPRMRLDEILTTYQRDFSNEFVQYVKKLYEKKTLLEIVDQFNTELA